MAVTAGENIRRSLERGTPWYAKQAVAWLEEHLPSGLVGVEYGGGGSTPWWAERLDRLYTVEASTIWAIALLDHMRRHPGLIARWRLLMVNCDWRHVGDVRKLRDHWADHPESLTVEAAEAMEVDYLTPPVRHADVVMVDGAIRAQCVEMVCAWAERAPIRLIVVDNMESRRTSRTVEQCIPADFERLDFAEEMDGKDVVTSVFVRSPGT